MRIDRRDLGIQPNDGQRYHEVHLTLMDDADVRIGEALVSKPERDGPITDEDEAPHIAALYLQVGFNS